MFGHILVGKCCIIYGSNTLQRIFLQVWVLVNVPSNIKKEEISSKIKCTIATKNNSKCGLKITCF